MKTQVEKFELGFVEYRLPNHIEKMRLAAKIGFTGKETLENVDLNIFEVLADVMEFLPNLVVKLEAKKDGKDLTWDDLMFEEEFLPVCRDMALAAYTGSFQKKEQSQVN